MGRLAATFPGEGPSASVADTNRDTGCPTPREDELPPTDVNTNQVTEGGGDAAPARELTPRSEELQQEPQDSGSEAPRPQEDGASPSAVPVGADNPVRARVREFLGSGVVKTSVLTRMERELVLKIAELSSKITLRKREIVAMDRDLKEKRADGDVLMNMLAGTRAELRLLRREMAIPQGEHLDESVPMVIMDYANDGFEGAAATLQHCGSSQPEPSDDAPSFSVAQGSEEDDLAAGESGGKNSPPSDHPEETEEEGKE